MRLSEQVGARLEADGVSEREVLDDFSEFRSRPSFDVVAVIRRARWQARMAYAWKGGRLTMRLRMCQESVELIERMLMSRSITRGHSD
jgi:hypothetical protein